MSDKVKQKNKADYVADAVNAGLGEEETLKDLTIPVLKQKMADAKAGIEEVIVSKALDPPGEHCAHDYKRVRVIASPNYVCERCWKCGHETEHES